MVDDELERILKGAVMAFCKVSFWRYWRKARKIQVISNRELLDYNSDALPRESVRSVMSG
jgi:hypothetical protein